MTRLCFPDCRPPLPPRSRTIGRTDGRTDSTGPRRAQGRAGGQGGRARLGRRRPRDVGVSGPEPPPRCRGDPRPPSEGPVCLLFFWVFFVSLFSSPFARLLGVFFSPDDADGCFGELAARRLWQLRRGSRRRSRCPPAEPPRPRPPAPTRRPRPPEQRGEEERRGGGRRRCPPALPPRFTPPRPPPRPWRRRRALLPPEAEGLFGFLFFILLSFVFLHKNQQL